MPIVGLMLLVLLATTTPARADLSDAREWYRRAQMSIDSLIGPRGPSQDGVITAPTDIDPKMAIVPPKEGGTLRILPPRSEGRGGDIVPKPPEPRPPLAQPGAR